jgi:hypothetical protein
LKAWTCARDFCVDLSVELWEEDVRAAHMAPSDGAPAVRVPRPPAAWMGMGVCVCVCVCV